MSEKVRSPEEISEAERIFFWLQLANNDSRLGRAIILAFENAIVKAINEKPEQERENWFDKLRAVSTTEDHIKLSSALGIGQIRDYSKIVNEAQGIYLDSRRN